MCKTEAKIWCTWPNYVMCMKDFTILYIFFVFEFKWPFFSRHMKFCFLGYIWNQMSNLQINKLKQSRYTPWRRLGERRYSSYSFTTSALDRGWVVGIMPRPRFSPGERTPGTHCTGGWVGPRDGLVTEPKGKILLPLPGIEPRSPGRPVRNQTLNWLSYPSS
jgi:hypothetical protein